MNHHHQLIRIVNCETIYPRNQSPLKHTFAHARKNSQPDQAFDQKEKEAGNAEFFKPGFEFFARHNLITPEGVFGLKSHRLN